MSYFVDRIIAQQDNLYLVHWEGYGANERTWEPLQNIPGGKNSQVVDAFRCNSEIQQGLEKFRQASTKRTLAVATDHLLKGGQLSFLEDPAYTSEVAATLLDLAKFAIVGNEKCILPLQPTLEQMEEVETLKEQVKSQAIAILTQYCQRAPHLQAFIPEELLQSIGYTSPSKRRRIERKAAVSAVVAVSAAHVRDNRAQAKNKQNTRKKTAKKKPRAEGSKSKVTATLTNSGKLNRRRSSRKTTVNSSQASEIALQQIEEAQGNAEMMEATDESERVDIGV